MDTNEHEDLNNKYEQKIEGTTSMISMEKKFLKLYKQLSHLWNPNHPDYNNRYRRNEGYDALLPIFKQYMPNATRFHIRQKINILRSCYRKDLRKHMASRTLDPDGIVVFSYIPTSWKFHALRFLDCDENTDNGYHKDETEIELCPEYEDEQELEFVESAETESGNDEPDTSKIHISPIYIEDDKPYTRKRYKNMSTRSFTSEEEILDREYNAIGSNVACKLQRMSVQQRYHAELLINKVLIQGLKEHLTEQTDLTANTWHIAESINDYSTSKSKSKDDDLELTSETCRNSY